VNAGDSGPNSTLPVDQRGVARPQGTGPDIGAFEARSEDETTRAQALGYNLAQVLTIDDLVRSNNVFFAATGITDGELLDGVQYYGDGARTHSLVMRAKSGTVREVVARHRWDKLMQFSQVKYD